MTDQNQTDAMADILRKLNNGVDKAQKGEVNNDPTSKAAQTDAMADVMRKLQAATGEAAYEMVAESASDADLGVAINTTRTEAGVSVSRYDIRATKKTVQEGINKTFYNITDNKTGTMLYDDLGLFETAMGVVKHTLFTKDENKVRRLLSLDQEYVGAVMEVYGLKNRLQRLDESSVQYDVASAKYSNSRTKLSAAKMKLLKAL